MKEKELKIVCKNCGSDDFRGEEIIGYDDIKFFEETWKSSVTGKTEKENVIYCGDDFGSGLDIKCNKCDSVLDTSEFRFEF